MKFLHLSDLHLGKRIHEFSLLEEQVAILNQIISIIDTENIDAVLIAGDVYDKSVPSAEAVGLFDKFLAELKDRKTHTFIISGNHDSPERIAFGSKIMKDSGIYLSPVYDGSIKSVTLFDEYGKIDVHLLPFIKPAHVKRFFEAEEINTYTDAVQVAVSAIKMDKTARNILISHQYVTGAERSESEETVGGLDNVDSNVFEDFDFVALGHLHRRQSVGEEKIHYSGTPLKYSFSEINDDKSVTVLEIKEKGAPLNIKFVSLIPVHDMSEIRGKFDDISSIEYYSLSDKKEDYLRIILTDEEDIPDAMKRLKAIYKNALILTYDNTRTRAQAIIDCDDGIDKKSPIELFEEFFEKQNNAKMSEEQKDYVQKFLEKAREEML